MSDVDSLEPVDEMKSSESKMVVSLAVVAENFSSRCWQTAGLAGSTLFEVRHQPLVYVYLIRANQIIAQTYTQGTLTATSGQRNYSRRAPPRTALGFGAPVERWRMRTLAPPACLSQPPPLLLLLDQH